MVNTRLIGLLLCATFAASTAHAQQPDATVVEMSFASAMERARTHAPALAAERAKLGEARARVVGASSPVFNPTFGVGAGPRFGAADTTVDWSVGAEQWWELGGQRAHRTASARARIDAAVARTDDAERSVVREVGRKFVELVYWEQRLALAVDNERIAIDVERVARHRHDVGDVGGLDQAVASLSVSRARNEIARARAGRVKAEGRLKLLLGLDAGVTVSPIADLRALGLMGEGASETNETLPDIRALEAQRVAAEFELREAEAHNMPNLGVGAHYEREEAANVLRATLTLSLPFFEYGQGAAAAAAARGDRIDTELRGARAHARAEAATARTHWQVLSDAARRFEQNGLATVDKTESISTASYQAGAIPLGELLAVRQELAHARRDYLELLLGAASAGVDLRFAEGGWHDGTTDQQP